MPTIRDSIRELARAQKTSRGVSLYSRFINRPMGRVLAAVGHRLGLSPNQVTLLSAAVTTAGLAVLVVLPVRSVAGIVGALLLILGFALDSADGQLSRLTGRSSAAGEWLDHVVDAGKMVAVHGAVLVAAWWHLAVPDAWLLVPLSFQLVAILTFAGGTLVPLLARGGPAAHRPSSPNLMRSVALLPADYGVLCVVLATIGVESVFVWLYPALLAVNVLVMAALLTRWFRQLSAS